MTCLSNCSDTVLCFVGNALFWAVVSDDMKIFELLLDKAGLDPFIRTQKNETLLHIAASLGHKDFIEILVKKCKIKYDVEDVGKKTALDR